MLCDQGPADSAHPQLEKCCSVNAKLGPKSLKAMNCGYLLSSISSTSLLHRRIFHWQWLSLEISKMYAFLWVRVWFRQWLFSFFFSICISFFVNLGTKAPMSSIRLIVLHNDQRCDSFYRGSIHKMYCLSSNPGLWKERVKTGSD